MLMPAELKWCVTWFIYFLNPLCVRYNCGKFHHCRICVTDFREGAFHPHPWSGLKKPILNRVKRFKQTSEKQFLHLNYYIVFLHILLSFITLIFYFFIFCHFFSLNQIISFPILVYQTFLFSLLTKRCIILVEIFFTLYTLYTCLTQ